MITRIGCGGFDIDNDTLIEEDGVLKVKNGGGDGGVFVVTMTSTGDTETGIDWTADKTCLEIIEALEQGKTVYAVQGDDAFKYYYFLTGAYHEPDFGTTIFFSKTEFGYDEDESKYKLSMEGFEMRWRSGGTDSVERQEYYYPQP